MVGICDTERGGEAKQGGYDDTFDRFDTKPLTFIRELNDMVSRLGAAVYRGRWMLSAALCRGYL